MPYYDSLVKETTALARRSSKVAALRSMEHFAQAVLPYYKTALLRYRHRIGSQGIFQAFELASQSPRRMLFIAICDEQSDGPGLREGARNAAPFNHRVLIAIPTRVGAGLAGYDLPEDLRIRVLESTARKPSSEINRQILELAGTTAMAA
jgi:hypothetical protein